MIQNLADQQSFPLQNTVGVSDPNPSFEASSKAIEGLVVVNDIHQIIGWNPSSSYLTGYSRESIMGSSILNLLASEGEIKAFEVDFTRLINENESTDPYYESVVNILTSTGTTKEVTFQWNRMILAGVRIFNICIIDKSNNGIQLDNFKEKELELARKDKDLAKLASSNQQLESFAYVASHDLKEPLRSIGNFTQLLGKRLEGKLDKTDKEFFGFVISGVKNMNNLIEDLLTYSRVNTGNHDVSEINLMDSLSIVINSLNKRIVETDAQIEIKELPTKILGNPTKIKQLFQNLISNSIKFQKPGIKSQVVVRGREENDRWVFSVSDNGIGIKEEYFQKVFGIFTKLHHKSKYPGSGIGLSVCQRIVEQHDGEIWVDSVFGGGTNFHFSISKNQITP